MPHRAYTIIELIIALLVVTLLAGTAAVYATNMRKSSRDARRIGDILLIAKSIDQSALVNRGAYPKNAHTSGTSRNDRMCANEIYVSESNNPARLDISLFSNRLIPVDPKPYSGYSQYPSNCADLRQGYTYHTQYAGTLASIAKTLGVTYTLEVGLEGLKPDEESILRAPSQLSPNPGLDRLPSPNGFYRYLFNGNYCGSTCYQ